MPLRTIIDYLEDRAQRHPEVLLYRFLTTGEPTGPRIEWSCGEVARRARAIGARLAEYAGQRVLLVYPPGPDYYAAFLGSFYAGAVPVPAYPPDLQRVQIGLDRLGAIARDADVSVVLTTNTLLSMVAAFGDKIPALSSLPRIATDTVDLSLAGTWRDPERGPQDIAFLQYTSGSTGQPKGVILTHDNLIQNSKMIQAGGSVKPGSHTVNWLPQYHDMGLMTGLIGPIYCEVPATLLSPLDFLRRPGRWLEAISSFGGTHGGGPDFAFGLCVSKVSPQARAQLDLSNWRVAWSGAEPVRESTMRAFVDAFAVSGFRYQAFVPCYGLAEATVGVTWAAADVAPTTLEVSRAGLERRRVEAPRPGDALTLVSCGATFADLRAAIVDPETGQAIDDGEQVGELWLRGSNVGRGYWGQPELSEQTFGAMLHGQRWLRTGDLAFMRDGELYIAGRLKDTIIIRGRNHYAHDLEHTIQSTHASVRPGCVVALSMELGGQERLMIAAELRDPGSASEAEARSIAAAITEVHGVVPTQVALLAPRTLPKTSSGKLQRYRVREAWRADELSVLARVELDQHASLGHADLETMVLGRLEGLIGQRVRPEARLAELGLDSVALVDLSVALERSSGVRLSPEALASTSTVGELLAKLQVQAPQAPRPGRSLDERLAAHANRRKLLEAADLMLFERPLARVGPGVTARMEGHERDLTVFSSYSYLGLIGHPAVIAAKREASERYGTGAHGVMLIGGYTDLHARLERRLARWLGCEDAVLYSSGFLANLAVLSTLLQAGDQAFCDLLAHRSLTDGCTLSGATVRSFGHQDVAGLARLLDHAGGNGGTSLVVVDGVYSLRGDLAQLPELGRVAHDRGALLLVDEAHALGAVGATGRGTAEQLGCMGLADLVTGGLGKAIPAYGGYVAGSRAHMDYLRFHSHPYVYSGGMDVGNAAAAEAALTILEQEPERMARLRANTARMHAGLEAAGASFHRWDTPVMPVRCPGEHAPLLAAQALLERGWYVAPILYPAVPRDEGGLRVTVTAAHTPEQIDAFTADFAEILHALADS